MRGRPRFLAKRSSGVTLIELIVVILLIGMTFAWGSIAGRQFLPGFRLGSAARQVATDLRLTRGKAIEQNRRFKAIFTDGGSTYRVQREDVYLSDVWSEHVLYGKEQGAGTALPVALPEQVTESGAEVVFDPRGSATTATLTLRHAAIVPTKAVTIDLAGTVTLQ